jgi:ABC-type cobalamin/Fe3+-siderophores transport system ATPase subunit
MGDGRSAATGTRGEAITPERLSEVWRVDAALAAHGASRVNRRGR